MALSTPRLLHPARMDKRNRKSLLWAVATILVACFLAFVIGAVLATPLRKLLLEPTHRTVVEHRREQPSTPAASRHWS